MATTEERVRVWCQGMQAYASARPESRTFWQDRLAAERARIRDEQPPIWQWRKRRRWKLKARIAELEIELGLAVY